MGSSTHPGVDHIQGPREARPTIAAVAHPIVLVVGHIGSAVDRIDSEIPIADSSLTAAPREADTDSVEDREVGGVYRQDGSNLSLGVEHSCQRRT